VDAFLAIASKREVRRYDDAPLPAEVIERILQAGRVAGSAKNRQPWRFHVLTSPEARAEVAEAVYAPDNLRGAALAVAVTVAGKGPTAFDAGRAAQNMMLSAANDGVGSCPNGVADAGAMARVLGLDEGETVATVLSFGYPARPRHPEGRPAAEWIAAADRKALEDVVRRS